MSVSPFDMGRMSQLYGSLANLNRDGSMFRTIFYTAAERATISQYGLYPEIEIIDDMARLIRNLYLSNQLAYMLTYEGSQEAWQLHNLEDLPKLCPPITTGLEAFYCGLYGELSNVRYNTITNGGTCFLPAADDQRIDRILEYVARLLVELLEGKRE